MPAPEEHPVNFDDRFLRGIDAFNAQHWYFAHDQLEELWHESSGEVRELLQGLIQVSVAEYHLENNNVRGATLLMAEGLNHLKSMSHLDVGYNLDHLRDLVSSRLSVLHSDCQLDGLEKPALLRKQKPDQRDY
ncbi:MAG: DUF309 domain-containing protein [Cyanobium sp.]